MRVVELDVDDVLDLSFGRVELAPPGSACCTRRHRRPGRHSGRDNARDGGEIGQLATETRFHHTTSVFKPAPTGTPQARTRLSTRSGVLARGVSLALTNRD